MFAGGTSNLPPVRVLLVDDDVDSVELVKAELDVVAPGGVVACRSLDAAFSRLDGEDFDCAVLDLALPDAWGLDTLLRFRRQAPGTPIVVLSGSQEPGFASKAARAGASGFLSKGTASPGDVAAAVIDAVQQRKDGTAPVDPLVKLAEAVGRRSPVSARFFGEVDLQEELRTHFQTLVERYGDLIELALERAAFEGPLEVGEHLRDLATALGALGAGPRDVVQLHSHALRDLAEDRQAAGAPEFVNEARLVVLELMGYLVSYYRSQALGRVPGVEDASDGS